MSKSSRGYVCLLLTVAIFSSPIFSKLSYAASADRIAGTIDSSNVVELTKSLHPKAQAKYDRGVVAPSLPLTYMTLYTTPSPAQQAALTRLLAQQQDPSSPNYHKWLTPAQYADRFGLSQNDMNRLTSWLQSQGFEVKSIGGGRNLVIFGGTAAQVQNAFKTEIHQYSVNGKEHFANSTPAKIPAALQGIVTGISGLHNFRAHPSGVRQIGSGPRTRPDYYDGDFLFPNFLGPGDVATIYGFSSLSNNGTVIDGTGEKIAIIGRTDIFLADINDFRNGFLLPAITTSNCTLNTATSTTSDVITACDDPHFKYILIPGQTDPLNPDSVAGGDIGEADLDVEWSGAVAPGAQVIYINAPETDVNDSLSYALDPPSGTPIPAPVVSLSYGSCEAEALDQESVLAQGVSEGITIVNSSGDSGAAGCDGNPPNGEIDPPYDTAVGGLAVSYPASSSYVIAAGGTAITLANDSYPTAATTYWNSSNATNLSSATRYIPETPWNDDEEWASYCHSPASNDTFCSSGGGTPGWVALSTTATAQQVQQDIWIFQGGGGASNCFGETAQGVCTSGIPQPSWQQNLAITTPHTSGVRWVPDISLLASPNFPGYIYCTPLNPDGSTPNYTSSCASGIFDAVDDNESLVGGTSVSAPSFAGIVVLLNQYLNGPSSPGLGDIHTTLYQLAATPANLAFNQVTTGDSMFYCDPGQPSIQTTETWIVCPSSGVLGYSASGTGNFDPTTGYNLVTGLGSVNVANLASAWAGTITVFTVSAGSVSPASVVAGSSATTTVTVAPVSGSGFTGNVTLSCPNTPAGISCPSFGTNPIVGGSGTSTVTIQVLPNVAAGSYSVTIKGTSGSSSTSTTVSLTVTASGQTFTLTPQNQTYNVTPGQTATVTVAVSSQNGFVTGTAPNQTTTAPLTWSCSDPASESTCTISTPTTNVTSVSFTITTTAPTGRLRRPLERSPRIFYAALLPGLLGIVFTFGSRKKSLRGVKMLGLIAVLGFSMLGLNSCSGSNNSSSSNPGTPANTYTITINATTGGSAPITGSTTIQLAVQ